MIIEDILNKIIFGIILGVSLTNYAYNKEINKKLDKLNLNISLTQNEIEENIDYNGIEIGDLVETNEEFGDKVSGFVLEFLYRGEAYPIALLDNDKSISVFWLKKVK